MHKNESQMARETIKKLYRAPRPWIAGVIDFGLRARDVRVRTIFCPPMPILDPPLAQFSLCS